MFDYKEFYLEIYETNIVAKDDLNRIFNSKDSIKSSKKCGF